MVKIFIRDGIMIGKTEFNIMFYGLVLLVGVVSYLGL